MRKEGEKVNSSVEGRGEMDRGRQIFGSRMLWVCTTADISLTLPLARLFPAVLRIDLTGRELLGFFPLSLSLSLSLPSSSSKRVSVEF